MHRIAQLQGWIPLWVSPDWKGRLAPQRLKSAGAINRQFSDPGSLNIVKLGLKAIFKGEHPFIHLASISANSQSHSNYRLINAVNPMCIDVQVLAFRMTFGVTESRRETNTALSQGTRISSVNTHASDMQSSLLKWIPSFWTAQQSQR
jgi:hypothetical protein